MQLIIDSYKKNGSLHHAYVIEGEREAIKENLLGFLEKDFNFPIRGNPDFWVEDFDSLGIDDSRALKEIHTNKAFGELGRKVYVISANFITNQAQNALLKILEEPGEGNHFFLVLPNAEILLPTLRSRVVIVSDEAGEKKDILALEFIKSSKAKRFEMIKELMDDIGDEKKSKAEAIELMGNIEVVLRKKGLDPKSVQALEHILKYKRFLPMSGASVKMILEHVALIAPNN